MAVTVERRCEHCGNVLASTSRPDRRHCSASCRSAAYAARRRAANSERVRNLNVPSAELEQVLARATEETRLVAVIAAVAGKGNWRAAAWLLERQHPERWGAQRRVQVELQPESKPDDPCREVDELARLRRERLGR
jgi:hypothetical protein